MTPYHLDVAINAFRKRMMNEQEENISTAWLGEYFHRLKKLKKLDEYLNKPKQKRVMSDDEMKDKVIQLNALFGGTIETKGSD